MCNLLPNVREKGLEPSRDFSHNDLNVTCLPIPPPTRVRRASIHVHSSRLVTAAAATMDRNVHLSFPLGMDNTTASG